MEHDEREIERLVRWIAGDFESSEHVALDRDPDAMRRLRDAAADAHRRWDAERTIEIEIDLSNVRIGGEVYDYAIELGGDDLHGIFSGTNAHERERENKGRLFKVIASCGAVAGLMVAAAIFEKRGHAEKFDEGARLTGQQIAAPDPIATEPVDPGGAVVSSCTCNTEHDRFTLMASEGSGWYVIRSSLLFPINAGDSGVPPASKSALRAAMGCDGDVVALVSGDVAAAWSTTGSGAPQWTRKLPSPVANPPQSMGCSGTLPVRGGRMTVLLVNGQRVSLSMRDGS